MSSGVDSSTVAALLGKLLGPERVHGVFMTNWTGAKCADGDWKQVQQVADQVGITCHRVDLEKDYWNEVFEPMLAEYRAGITPNPDVGCNRYVKFGSLIQHLKQRDPNFKWIATGHYAGIEHRSTGTVLTRPKDLGKDQSYYLATVGLPALKHALFPLSGFTKPEVRELAKEFNLVTALKKDSQGLCFVEQTERGFHNFLSEFLEPNPGPVTTVDGRVVGQHQGLWTATIGQRSSISMPQSDPEMCGKWFVSAKIPDENRMVIVRGGNNPELFHDNVECHDFTWNPELVGDMSNLTCQYRSLQEPVLIRDIHVSNGTAKINFASERRAVAPGQYLAVYSGDVMVGAGVIKSASRTRQSQVLASSHL